MDKTAVESLGSLTLLNQRTLRKIQGPHQALVPPRIMTDTKQLEDMINEGLRYHGTGNLRDASTHYQRALSINPKHPVGLHFLGVIALQTGNYEAAAKLIAQALEEAPGYGDAHSNLGNVFQAMKRFEDAAECYERALTLNPQMAEVRANLGNARLQLGDYRAASENFETALRLNPNLPEVHRNLAVALLALERPYDAWNSVVRSQQLNPSSIELILTAGNVLQALRQYDRAIECYEQVLKVQANFPAVLCNLGNVHRATEKLDRAAHFYDRAIEIDGNYVDAHHGRGIIHQDLGNTEAARLCFQRALAIDPLHGKSHRSQASLTKHSERDVEIVAMEKAFSAPDISNEQNMFVAYGLGKSLEDIGQHEEAFRYYEIANDLRRSAIDYSIEQESELFANIKQTFTPALLERHNGRGITDPTPIFVVGMPRSGTSLVEQILASHHEIHGAGELETLTLLIARSLATRNGADYTASVSSATTELLNTIGTDYLKHLRTFSSSTTHVIDKLPSNFLNIGMIHLIFPNARIIHCQRNPVDTCLSIYKNYFSSSGHNYSYDLRELGAYYSLYEDLMAHWNKVLPERLLNIRYEELVANQESETRRLIDACGLVWDPSCMDFHNTQRPVFTISAAQVRRPIYTDSVELWRRYEKQLAPLLGALNLKL